MEQLPRREKYFKGDLIWTEEKRGKASCRVAVAAVATPQSFERPLTTVVDGRRFMLVEKGKMSRRRGSHVITSQISVGERSDTEIVFHSGIINDLNLAASSNIIKIPKFNVVNRFMHKQEVYD